MFRFLRQRLGLPAAVLITAFAVSAARAGGVSATFSFTPDDVTLVDAGSGESVVALTDGEYGEGNPGKPWIPYRTVSIRLPAGERLASWSVDCAGAVSLAENVVPVPEQLPVPTDGQPHQESRVTRDAAAYASTEPYPARRGELLAAGSMRGIRIVSFRIAPVAFVGAEKRLYLTPSVTVKVETEPAEEAGTGSPLFDSAANSLVVNPTRGPVPLKLAAVAGGGGGAQYLVITTKALASVAQRLADFRAGFDGVTAAVVTLEDIAANADWSDLRPDGQTDVQTKIRSCIAWHVRNRGTEYVVLAGDDTVVPVRRVRVEASGKKYTDAPCDLYYSDLDGTWDRNADGEYAYTRDSDGTDLYPDVVVGRIPVRTAAQLYAYVSKVIAYERGTTDDSDIVRKTLWGGRCTQQELVKTDSGWNMIQDDVSDGRNHVVPDVFADGLLEVADRPTGARMSDTELWGRRLNQSYHRAYRPNLRTSFFYDSATSWDVKSCGDFDQTSGSDGNVQRVLNCGYHQVFIGCHGAVGSISLEEPYAAAYASVLTNRMDFIYTTACLTAAFDDATDPCFSEAFLRAPGGALGYIGCSREGWSIYMSTKDRDDWTRSGRVDGESRLYAKEFYKRVFADGDARLGVAFANHKAARIGSCNYAGSARWTQLLLNLQGDPLLTYHLPPANEADPRPSGRSGLVTMLRDNLPEPTASALSARIAADEIPLGSSAKVELEYSKSSTFASGVTAITVDAAAKRPGEYALAITGLDADTDYYLRGRMTMDGVTRTSPFALKLRTQRADYVSPTPVFSTASCRFTKAFPVTLASAAPDVTIRYTTDGSEPTSASAAYVSPLYVDFTLTVSAAAFRNGVRVGDVVVAQYEYDFAADPTKGDAFDDPIAIRGAEGDVSVPSFLSYSVEEGEIDHTEGKRKPATKTIWFTWTAPGSGEVSFSTKAVNGINRLPHGLAVYTGSTMSGLQRVGSDGTVTAAENPKVVFTARQGEVYRVTALCYATGSATFDCRLNWVGVLDVDPDLEPDPGSVTEPAPHVDYEGYRIGDGTPQAVMVSYYDGPDTRGFAWQTSTAVSKGALWLLAGSYGKSADSMFATNLVATAASAKHTECYTHKAHVTGMKPGTYSYRVGEDGHYAYGAFTVKDAKGPFVALNVNDVQTKDVAAIGCWDRTLVAAKSVLGGGFDTFISGGDFIDGGTSYPDYIEWGVAADRARAVFPDAVWTMASGNHDPSLYDKVVDENFRHTVSGHWGCHSFDAGGAHIATVPYYNSWNSAVGAWLEGDLAACTSKWRVVVMHYGPYTTVDHGCGADDGYVKAVAAICTKGRVDLVLQAHDHGYSKTLPYLWSGAGYAKSDADRAATVNVSPTVESVGGESYYRDPKGTVYVSAGCAGHRVGEGKSYATGAYRNRGTKIFVDTVKVGSDAGAEASLVPDDQMFGVLRIDGDRLAYDWYLAKTDGSVVLFDSLRILKTAASDAEEEEGGEDEEPDPPGPGGEPGAEDRYATWGDFAIPYGGPAKSQSGYAGTTDTVLVFTNGVGSFTLPAKAQVKVLVVGGGGGAGGSFTAGGSLYFGMGGDGGEVVETELALTAGTYTVSVGAGGAGGDGKGKSGGNDGGRDGTASGIWSGETLVVKADPGLGGLGGETADQKGTGGSGGSPTTGVASTVYTGTYGKGGRDSSNTDKVGDSAADNTGDGGRGARGGFPGGSGGSGIVVVRITDMGGTAVEPTTWDVAGGDGGINGIDDGHGVRRITVKSFSLADGRLRLEFEAGRVDADGAVFGLVCKEDLADSETFTIDVKLTNGPAATLGTLEGLVDRPQLFILGIGPRSVR